MFIRLLGPYLASGAINLITGACVVASLQLAQSVLFPPAPRVGKLRNDRAPKGAVRRKLEACSSANVPWCYFAVSENKSATNQEIPGLKSVARCSDAFLGRMHKVACAPSHTLCFSHLPSHTFLVNYLGKNS